VEKDLLYLSIHPYKQSRIIHTRKPQVRIDALTPHHVEIHVSKES
jgi:hypothetical protein